MRQTHRARSLSQLVGGLAVSLATTLLAFGLSGPSTRGQDLTGNDAWIPLFNGKDLQGWTPKITKHDFGDNYAETFRVENGVLKVAYDKYLKCLPTNLATCSPSTSIRTIVSASSIDSSAISAPAGRSGPCAIAA